MAKRKFIEIDRDKCDGCGLCTTACAEGALTLDEDNKAVLLKEIYCDGMGACLDVCPAGALEIIEREGDAYSAGAAYAHVLQTKGKEAASRVHGMTGIEHHKPSGAGQRTYPSGCPGTVACEIPESDSPRGRKKAISGASELRQWPIQLHLVSPSAPYFESSDLLIAADCTAFALGTFHRDLLKGKKLIIACPKLDETESYSQKLAEIIKQNNPKSLTVAIMTVPCCSGLYQIMQTAVELSGIKIDLKKKLVHIDAKRVS